MHNKIKIFCLIIGLSLIFFAGCTPKKKIVNSFIYYKVDVECEAMGYINGRTRQNPLVGDYTTEVTAVANKGYVFVRWSDDNVEASRKDKSTETIFVTYTAYFESLEE